MARDFRGIPFSTLPEPDAVDFTFRLRNMLSELDQWARDQSFAMGRIERGQVPNGSGDPLPGGDGLDLPDDVGAVLFIDSGPSLGSDGDVFFWDTTNTRLGIGTNSPDATFHILHPEGSEQLVPTTTGTGWGNGIAFAFSGAATRHECIDDPAAVPDEDATYCEATVGASGFFWTFQGPINDPAIGLANVTSATLYCRAYRTGISSPSRFLNFFLTKAVGSPETKIAQRSLDTQSDLTGSYVTYSYTLTAPELADYISSTGHQLGMTVTDNEPSAIRITQLYMLIGSDIDIMRWDLNGGAQSGRITSTGRVGIGTGSDSLIPMLTVESDAAAAVGELIKGATSQSGNLLEFRSSADTLLGRFTAAGVFDAPIVSDYTGYFFRQVIFDGITNAIGNPFIKVASGATFTGTGPTLDDSSGFLGEIQGPAAGLTADRWWAFPDGSGNLIVSGVAANLQGTTGSSFQSSTSTTGASFQDITTSTKRLRFVLSGSVGNNFITIANTAARGYTLGDVSSGVTQLGIAASAAGTLGRSVLTGQNASIGATTLLTSTTVTAGLYRVSFYLKTTTAGDALDNVTVTLAWNDGTAQTEVMGFLGTTSNILPYTNHDLATNNAFSHASVVVRAAASTAITYTTTLTSPGAGTPVYTIDARLEFLG